MAAAGGKNADPFEAFKQKKAQEQKQKLDQVAVEAQNKALGWIDGIGPTEKQDPTKPKGFVKGRYKKPPVDPNELDNLRPGNLEKTRLANSEPTDVDSLPPPDERRPKNFGKY